MITVCESSATGKSPKLAFDNALRKIGMDNFNIVQYSSVIPPNEDVSIQDKCEQNFSIGTPVACVLAEDIGYETDTESHLGWWYDNNGGVFLEFSGEEYVEEYIKEMVSNRGWDTRNNQPEHISARCSEETGLYSCSICIAVYGNLKTGY
jgi:pyruvoyl-dependent arginine decarboxylase (PvlArgDC)